MKGIFVESPIFEKHRQKYLNDDEFINLQNELLESPKASPVIQGTGGLRKIRIAAKGKGKRSGARVIYYYFDNFKRFYLLTIYAKNEVIDLSPNERQQLKTFMEAWKNEQA
ncbi:MAG: type II toxin-antitoxin system RelE/ParE family toxin [Enterobacterales bacterium]|nr:type II toxin-antitoxin system RelE/ParE family toxin [Enterobacterales bacterium]